MRDRIGWLAAVTGAASIAGTLVRFFVPFDEGVFSLVELGALIVLVALSARWAPVAQAVAGGVLAGLAVGLWVVPLVPDPSPLAKLGGFALWSLAPAGVAVISGYPRLAEHRRRGAVARARQEQRLELARDLHDFVAHDVSGIVVQAQAALLLLDHDRERAREALRRIEAAGLRALASMDRTVDELRREPQPGLADLPGLVADFRDARVDLEMEEQAVSEVPREIGATVYRIVVEALTNVRRHAAGASRVTVGLRRTPEGLTLTVADDGGRAGGGASRGGSGLAALAERVRALGGTLSAGPTAGGWTLTAVLPL
ncbi:histidine kinase [Streptosporangium sp. NPDC048865]|uniref:sensor histidine kinase n=1 Tax=Streptosporangium sp. NPDC048865 TaxID=3155766 RepID=UPI00343BF809